MTKHLRGSVISKVPSNETSSDYCMQTDLSHVFIVAVQYDMRTRICMVPDGMYCSVAQPPLNTIKHMMYIKHRLLTWHGNTDLPSAKITLDLQSNTNDRRPIMRLHNIGARAILTEDKNKTWISHTHWNKAHIPTGKVKLKLLQHCT